MEQQSSEQKMILEMLSQGKITVDEAQDLLRALGENPAGQDDHAHHADQHNPHNPVVHIVDKKCGGRFLRILVEKEGRKNVNIKIPLKLARLGMKFIPREARVKIDQADLNIEELMDDIECGTIGNIVDVDEGTEKVRIFVE